MSDYSERLISMAGGDGEASEIVGYEMDFGEPSPVIVAKTYTKADLREAKAQAWDESSRAIKATIGGYAEEGVWAFEQAEKLNPNPYRAALTEGAAK